MSYAGETLVNELKNIKTEIVYGIDRNADCIYSEINIISIEDELGQVDAVMVTVITIFDEIEYVPGAKLNCPVLSLEIILYEV